MNKYLPTNVSGDSWVRSKRIVVENPLLTPTRTIKYSEEKVVQLADDTLFKSMGTLEVTLDESMLLNEIDIVDPITGEPTGHKVSYQDIYAIFYSSYIHFATQRDNPIENDGGSGDGELPPEDENGGN